MKAILGAFLLCPFANAGDNIDPIEKAIAKNDIKSIDLLLSNKISASQKQKYLGLANVAIEKSQKNFVKKFNSKEDFKMALGAIGFACSAWMLGACYELYKNSNDESNNPNTEGQSNTQDDGYSWQLLTLSGAILGYLSFNELHKGFDQYDRKKAYNNARLIKAIIKDIQAG